MTINIRIKKIREELKLSQDEFSTTLGLQRNTISLIENEKRNPSERTLKDICREFNVDYHWLTTGDGEMFIETDTNYIALIDRIMAGDNEFAKNMFKTFTKFNVEDWEALEHMIDMFIDIKNKKPDSN